MWHVFGDESRYEKTIVYGVIALPESKIQMANNTISDLKKRFEVPDSAEFHSKIIFHKDKRRKSAWSILNEAQTFDFAEAFISLLKDKKAIFSVGAVHRDDNPLVLPAGGMFPVAEMETKQLTAVVFQAAMRFIVQWLGAANIQLWIDPDATKVSWFGKTMRIDRQYKAIIPGSDDFIQPQNAGLISPVLLEAADLFAYICSHSLSYEKCRQQERFEALYRRCRPLLNTLTYDPEKRLKNQVHTSTLEIKHASICGDDSFVGRAFEVFSSLQVGACTWMEGIDRSGMSYPYVWMKMPKGQAQEAMVSRKVDIRAAIRVVGAVPVPCVLFRFRDDPTIYTTFPNHRLDPENSPLTQLSQGKELRISLFEENPEPIGAITFQHTDAQFWSRLIEGVDRFPKCTEEEFWLAASTLGSPQELWDSI